MELEISVALVRHDHGDPLITEMFGGRRRCGKKQEEEHEEEEQEAKDTSRAAASRVAAWQIASTRSSRGTKI